MKKITINVSTKYDCYMSAGILREAGCLIKETLPHVQKVAIITDDLVSPLYGEDGQPLMEGLHREGFETSRFIFKNGEQSKTTVTVVNILEFLASEEAGLTRTDALIALGGGVTGDMTGFAAAVYLRGIPFIQIPTTLLAAVDSSVGGKTGVNLEAGKNLAGAFKQPALVLFDTDTLKTLPPQVYRDGLAEAVKCGFIQSPSLLEKIRQGTKTVCCDKHNLRDYPCISSIEEIAADTVTVKKTLVEADEKDTGARQLLNFGHTIGHAIEKCSNYTCSHGSAVAIGMKLVTQSAEISGIAEKGCTDNLTNILLNLGFDLNCPYSAQDLAREALKDKKRRGNTITLVIPQHPGLCTLHEMPVDTLEGFIQTGLQLNKTGK